LKLFIWTTKKRKSVVRCPCANPNPVLQLHKQAKARSGSSPGDNRMTRTFALTATILLSHALATSIQAQSTRYDDGGFDPTASGILNYGTMPNGSFGIEYGQPLRAGSLIMDQYGMVYATPSSELAPRPVFAQPAPVTRTSGSASNRAKARPRYPLPTGSLGWNSASSVILYSPATRHETYGSGYARSPYGVVDYGYMSKGWPFGY
jgi:hypothetical protein